MSNLSFKKAVYQRCCELVDKKIATVKEAMEAAQSAATSEEKSTAGDKYDTARAMSHLTRDMYAQQLDEALKLKKALSQIDPERKANEIENGSMVVTKTMTYFIAVSLGVIEVNNKKVAAISPVSPLGQKLLQAKAGDEIEFNKAKLLIDLVS